MASVRTRSVAEEQGEMCVASSTWRDSERGWERIPTWDWIWPLSNTDKSGCCKRTESSDAFSHPSPGILVQPEGFQTIVR